MNQAGTIYLRTGKEHLVKLTPKDVKAGDKIQWMRVVEVKNNEYLIHNAKVICFPSRHPTKLIVQNYCEDWMMPMQKVLIRKTRVVKIIK